MRVFALTLRAPRRNSERMNHIQEDFYGTVSAIHTHTQPLGQPGVDPYTLPSLDRAPGTLGYSEADRSANYGNMSDVHDVVSLQRAQNASLRS